MGIEKKKEREILALIESALTKVDREEGKKRGYGIDNKKGKKVLPLLLKILYLGQEEEAIHEHVLYLFGRRFSNEPDAFTYHLREQSVIREAKLTALHREALQHFDRIRQFIQEIRENKFNGILEGNVAHSLMILRDRFQEGIGLLDAIERANKFVIRKLKKLNEEQ